VRFAWGVGIVSQTNAPLTAEPRPGDLHGLRGLWLCLLLCGIALVGAGVLAKDSVAGFGASCRIIFRMWLTSTTMATVSEPSTSLNTRGSKHGIRCGVPGRGLLRRARVARASGSCRALTTRTTGSRRGAAWRDRREPSLARRANRRPPHNAVRTQRVA
jgi:hypothetical protein